MFSLMTIRQNQERFSIDSLSPLDLIDLKLRLKYQCKLNVNTNPEHKSRSISNIHKSKLIINTRTLND